MSKTVRVEVLPIDKAADLDPSNVNRHTKRGGQLVSNSLKRRGAFRSIASAGKGVKKPVTYAGNLTLSQAREAGVKQVINVHTDGSQLVNVVRDDIAPGSAEAVALGLEDNESAKQSYSPDIDVLASLAAGDSAILSALRKDDQTFGSMLEGMGLEGDEPTDAEPQIDRAAELLVKWGVVTGDLWQIGEHRLLCGDSTKREDVELVMGGEKVDCTVTDPPYGVGVDYETFQDTPENVKELMSKVMPIILEHLPAALTPGVPAAFDYPKPAWIGAWVHPAPNGGCPWGFVGNNPILYYGADPYLKAGKGRRPDSVVMASDRQGEEGHPTPKPQKVWEWLVERLTPEAGQIVFDPFCGSGTTLVACENLGRKGRAIEISPAYCSVILERMSQAFPQLEIKRL